MSHCMSACKTIVMMCEEARAMGKKHLRINKIENLADQAVQEDLSEERNKRSNWHTGLPTETGEYLVCIKYNHGTYYTTANYVEPFNPHTGWYNLKPPSEIDAEKWCKEHGIEVIAWQRITPLQEYDT